MARAPRRLDRGLMGDHRVRIVAHPTVYQLACALCGVLLCDTDAHYRFTHAAGGVG